MSLINVPEQREENLVLRQFLEQIIVPLLKGLEIGVQLDVQHTVSRPQGFRSEGSNYETRQRVCLQMSTLV